VEQDLAVAIAMNANELTKASEINIDVQGGKLGVHKEGRFTPMFFF
jgi:hypothetical protein